jgi:hypothetical protein
MPNPKVLPKSLKPEASAASNGHQGWHQGENVATFGQIDYSKYYDQHDRSKCEKYDD